MSSNALSSWKIITLALILSFLLHYIALNFLILVFPQLHESLKPRIIFHGSFLKDSDTIGMVIDPSSQSHIPELNHSWAEIQNTPYYRAQLSKPPMESELLYLKETRKSVFEIEESQEKQKETDLGIDIELRPYQPLTFGTK